jgi:exodeoxyribonuclease V beta subunit
MQPFDVVSSPLRSPEGFDAVPHPLLIEASAGSGKTWTLAHLAVRFLLEDGVTPDQLLLVTFTRDAAQALRGRVRAHLMSVLSFLESLEGATPSVREVWQQYYAEKPPEVLASYVVTGRQRLGELDSLHAQTIHSFASDNAESSQFQISDGVRQWRQACNEVIAAVALASPDEFERLLEISTLATVVATAKALYDAGCRMAGGRTLETLTILPDDDDDDQEEDGRAPIALARFQKNLALGIVERYESLLIQSGVATFSELISGLEQRLSGSGADRFITEMRHNFRVVMIDEFQDTDPLQWDIFRRLFLDVADMRLIVVGDPKQAIYGFRSGSVETFLAVRDLCHRRGVPISTLPVNYRSSPELLDGVNRFFANVDFHYDVDEARPELAIQFALARAQPHPPHAPHVASLTDEPGAAFHLRIGGSDDKQVLREVGQYIELLHGRKVEYSKMAVLCYGNRQCRQVQRHLVRRGIPAVTSSDENVFNSDASFQLRLLLAALVAPDRASYSEALRATWFRNGAGAGGEPGEFVYRLANEFTVAGAAALARFLNSAEVLRVVLGTRDGERHVTDLIHLAEILARECRTVRSLPLVLEWLDTASEKKSVDETAEARRLETESDAVRIMTIHKAKGLEFDTVLVPFLNQRFPEVAANGPYSIRRWVTTDSNVIDAGSALGWGDVSARELLTIAGVAAEQRRLAYVALTRAERHLVVWLGLPKNVPLQGEFARLVFDRENLGEAGPRCRNRPLREVTRLFVGGGRAKKETDEGSITADPVAHLRGLWRGVATVDVHGIGDEVLATRVASERHDDVPMAPRTFQARRPPHVQFERRRWSYTDLASSLKRSPVAVDDADEETTVGGYDERTSDLPSSADQLRVMDTVRSVFGGLAGARLGAAVHSVLERSVGVAVPAALAAAAAAALAREGFSSEEIEANMSTITTALSALLTRPTGELLESRALSDLAPRDVAKEMRFVLALGDHQFDERLAAMARVLVTHDRSNGDGRGRFHEYFRRLSQAPEGLNQGFLVGSLDLVARRSDNRYVIVDYKTDQLPGEDRPFAPDKLFASMEHEHYPLQAVLYSVALHRHLRQALRGYDPPRHLGGVGYFYLRVVGDPSALAGDGFATWHISPEAVVEASAALSDVL